MKINLNITQKTWWSDKIGDTVDIIKTSKFKDQDGYVGYGIQCEFEGESGYYIYEQDIAFVRQERKLKLKKLNDAFLL